VFSAGTDNDGARSVPEAVVLANIGLVGQTVGQNLQMLFVTFVACLLSGLLRGGGYDHFTHRRTFLSSNQSEEGIERHVAGYDDDRSGRTH
jgi:hypothetical protein